MLSKAFATPNISIKVSTELSSCRWICLFDSPWTEASASIRELRTLLENCFASSEKLFLSKKSFKALSKTSAVLWSLDSFTFTSVLPGPRRFLKGTRRDRETSEKNSVFQLDIQDLYINPLLQVSKKKEKKYVVISPVIFALPAGTPRWMQLQV